MSIRNLTKVAVLILVVAAYMSGFLISPVQAEGQDDCTTSSGASAITKLPKGTYDVYAKLAVSSSDEQAKVSIMSLSGEEINCLSLGSGLANAREYSRLGTSVAIDEGMWEVLLDSPSVSSHQTAGGPQVVFVPAEKPVCDFSAGCSVKYAGQDFSLTPKKVSLGSDSLRVGLLEDFTNKTIKKVVYSVDGEPVYELNKLLAFDERYVPGGEHSLGRRIILENGMSLSDSKVIKHGSVANPTYIVQSFIFRQSVLILVLLGLALLLLIWLAVLYVLKKRARRKLWQKTHIAHQDTIEFNPKLVGAQKTFHEETAGETLWRHRRLLFVMTSIIAIMLISNSYVVTFFTVDGVSMHPTLEDKSVHPLVKLQKSLSRLNRSEYLPHRGDVVVLNKDENNLFIPAEEQVKTYVVKRVIGLPNERVSLQNGIITIYNQQYPDGFVPDNQYKWVEDTRGSEDLLIDITLKESELFVVGDNRDESIDSRFYGPVDTTEVIGKVRL